jgi:hypothetical protein
MYKPLTQTYTFHSGTSATIINAYPKDAITDERQTHFMPEEIEESDGYIVCYPYADKNAPIVATIKDGFVFLTIERDCYEIEMGLVHLVGEIAEIYYDSEDIELVREHLTKYYRHYSKIQVK